MPFNRTPSLPQKGVRECWQTQTPSPVGGDSLQHLTEDRGPGMAYPGPSAFLIVLLASVPDGAAEGPGGGATVPELLQRPDKPNSQT